MARDRAYRIKPGSKVTVHMTRERTFSGILRGRTDDGMLVIDTGCWHGNTWPRQRVVEINQGSPEFVGMLDADGLDAGLDQLAMEFWETGA